MVSSSFTSVGLCGMIDGERQGMCMNQRIAMLEETLSILAQDQVKGLDKAKVFLPDDLERMERMIGKRAHERAGCRYACVNMDRSPWREGCVRHIRRSRSLS